MLRVRALVGGASVGEFQSESSRCRRGGGGGGRWKMQMPCTRGLLSLRFLLAGVSVLPRLFAATDNDDAGAGADAAADGDDVEDDAADECAADTAADAAADACSGAYSADSAINK